MPKHKTKNIFEFIKCVFLEKTPWEELSESDQKAFNSYMMNRWISMHYDYVGIINYLQQFTIGILKPRESYKLLCDLLPRQKFWAKYITSKKDKGKNNKEYPNDNLIGFVAERENWSIREAESNLSLLFHSNFHEYIETMNSYLGMYGIDTNERTSKYGVLPF